MTQADTNGPLDSRKPPSYFGEALSDAERLLKYAAEIGIDVDSDTRSAILHSSLSCGIQDRRGRQGAGRDIRDGPTGAAHPSRRRSPGPTTFGCLRRVGNQGAGRICQVALAWPGRRASDACLRAKPIGDHHRMLRRGSQAGAGEQRAPGDRQRRVAAGR